jgi:hypothetical protein
MKNNRTIKYISGYDAYPEIVLPIKNKIPKWYKDSPNLYISETTVDVSLKGFKLCSPFFDSLATGYTVLLPMDILVVKENGVQLIKWVDGSEQIVDVRQSKENSLIPVPAGHSSVQYVWKFPAIIEFPSGYSAVLTHPLNRFDLPFTSLSGIIDGNFILSNSGNYPFFLKEDFEGVIKQGTPIVQIIPFKRESWKSKKDNTLKEKSLINIKKTTLVLHGWYKKNFWQKKLYE